MQTAAAGQKLADETAHSNNMMHHKTKTINFNAYNLTYHLI